MHVGVLYYKQLKHRWQAEHRHHSEMNSETQFPASKSITSARDVMNKQLNLENSPCPEIHRSRRTQGIMTGEWRGQNLRKTVGECEIEVGRHKHMHEMRQCSSVLLGGTDATVP